VSTTARFISRAPSSTTSIPRTIPERFLLARVPRIIAIPSLIGSKKKVGNGEPPAVGEYGM
jgi:hypothetical protein